MKISFISSVLIMFFTNSILCQNFILKINPDTIFVNQGDNALFQLNAIPSGGFNASIFLSLQEFQTNSVTIFPSTLNSPYNNCSITVSTNLCTVGIHRLIIKGQQGSLVSYDTAYIVINFNPLLKWYQFTSQNSGISGNNPYDIGVDKNNNIWLCTDNGLVKYNRENWFIWNNGIFRKTDFWGNVIIQQNNAMINSIPWSIDIDSNNVKWIGTENGLIKYNDTTFNLLFPDENVYSVSCFNNKVCIGTSFNGIKYFNGQNWISYTSSNSSNSYLPYNTINKVKMENDSIMWIGTMYGLTKFDLNYWTIYNHTNTILTSDNVRTIAIDKNKKLYFCTSGSGLYQFNNSIFQEFNTPCQELSAIYPDSIGNIWEGFCSGNTNNALVKFDGSSSTIYNSSNSGFHSDATTPGYGRIYSINKDKNGVLLIGTYGDGLFAYSEDSILSILPNQVVHSPTIFSETINFNIFPNPTKNILTVEVSDYNFSNISIKSINGQELLKLELKDNRTQIDMSKFQIGIYFIRFSSDKSVIVKKIIKL